jgi:hypothetical protein
MATIRGIQGGYPDLGGFPKQFAPARKLIDELARLRDQDRRAGMRIQELKRELEYQRGLFEEAKAVAMRNQQPEPSPRV